MTNHHDGSWTCCVDVPFSHRRDTVSDWLSHGHAVGLATGKMQWPKDDTSSGDAGNAFCSWVTSHLFPNPDLIDRSVQLILGPSFGPTEIMSFPDAFSSPPGPTGSWGTSLGGNGIVGQVQFRPWVQIEVREKRGGSGLSPRDLRLLHGARASGHRALSTTIGPSRPLTE